MVENAPLLNAETRLRRAGEEPVRAGAQDRRPAAPDRSQGRGHRGVARADRTGKEGKETLTGGQWLFTQFRLSCAKLASSEATMASEALLPIRGPTGNRLLRVTDSHSGTGSEPVPSSGVHDSSWFPFLPKIGIPEGVFDPLHSKWTFWSRQKLLFEIILPFVNKPHAAFPFSCMQQFACTGLNDHL